MIIIGNIKNVLINILDFLIGIIVIFGSILGVAEILKDLLGFLEVNSFCGILSILFIARVIYLISESKKK